MPLEEEYPLKVRSRLLGHLNTGMPLHLEHMVHLLELDSPLMVRILLHLVLEDILQLKAMEHPRDKDTAPMVSSHRDTIIQI
jgi:hypothetical protein